MKKFLIALSLSLFAALSVTSCAAWFSQLKSDPITAIETAVNDIQSSESLAQGAFDLWAGTVSPAQAAGARTQFNVIMTRISQALTVVQDALHAAADAHQPAPNPAALLADVQAAVSDLWSFLMGLTGNSPTPSGAVIAHATSPQMQSALTALDHIRGRHY
jgi:hypothetical protein